MAVMDDLEEGGAADEVEEEELVFITMCKMVHDHVTSRNRPPVTFDRPPRLEPWIALQAHVFREHTRFLVANCEEEIQQSINDFFLLCFIHHFT
jgi:hypothetical protein